MTGENLADHLNWNNFRTSFITTYAGSLGTYTLIHATYDWLLGQGDQAAADKVAKAFMKPDGSYAYDK